MVIQRWQSVLLLVAAVVMGLASFQTLAQIQGLNDTYVIMASGIKTAGIATDGAVSGWLFRSWTLLTMTMASALLPLLTIFLFRNLKLQMRLTLVCILFTITTAAIAAVTAYDFASGAPVIWTQYSCTPLLAVVAETMAWQRMRSDKRKLAAADRFR